MKKPMPATISLGSSSLSTANLIYYMKISASCLISRGSILAVRLNDVLSSRLPKRAPNSDR